MSTQSFTTGSVTSADGTVIGYRQIGSGPGLIILHGAMRSSEDYIRLAETLSDAFTVYIPDRRGRGLSGTYSGQYSMMKECEDLDALLTKTGAQMVFGHSAGGLIALQATLTLSKIQKVAVFEPPLSINNSVPISWVPRFEQELAEGKLASALVTAGKGLPIMRLITLTPRLPLLPIMAFGLWSDKRTVKPGSASIESLIPTLRYDMQLIKTMNNTLDNFKVIHAEALLLGGGKSPAFLPDALDALNKTVPNVRRIEYAELDHDGPIDGNPERVGADLHKFFE